MKDLAVRQTLWKDVPERMPLPATNPPPLPARGSPDEGVLAATLVISDQRLGNRISIWLFLVLWGAFVYTHQVQFDGPTAVSRLDVLHAILVHGTVRIDAYHENTPDKALYQGHYYSDKAPGTVVLAFIPFGAAAVALEFLGIGLGTKPGWLMTSWISCAGSIAVVAALGGVAMFNWLGRRAGSRAALITTLALFLGAAPLPYSTMMFSHSAAVGLIALSLFLLDSGPKASGRSAAREPKLEQPLGPQGTLSEPATWLRQFRPEIAAGLACGLALASEYTVGLVVTGILIWLGVAQRQRMWPFLLGMVPPLVLIPAYSWVCFKHPFLLPYTLQASFPQMQEGLYAIKWPNLAIAIKLLFSPARGLFFWTPFLGLALFGYRRLARVRSGLFWLMCALPLVQVIVISGRVWDWPAGPTVGPRYLAPMLPLLALPCAFGVGRFPRIGVGLAAYSILVTTIATLTNACPDFRAHPNPLVDFQLPLLLKGKFSPNLATAIGLSPWASLLLFYSMLMASVWWLWTKLPKELEPAAMDARCLRF